MKNTYLFVLGLGLASIAQAADLDQLTQVGAAIENRKTGEQLVLKCAEVTEEDGLKAYSDCYFLKGYALDNGTFQVNKATDGAEDVSEAIEDMNPEIIAQILTLKKKVQIQGLTGHLLGTEHHYDQYDYENEAYVGERLVDYAAIWNLWAEYLYDAEDRTHGGALWRGAALVIGSPVVAAVDAAAIGGAAITDGLRYAGEGAYVGVHNGVQKVRRGIIRNRVKKALNQVQNANFSGETIKVSNNVFTLISGAAFGVDLEGVLDDLSEDLE